MAARRRVKLRPSRGELSWRKEGFRAELLHEGGLVEISLGLKTNVKVLARMIEDRMEEEEEATIQASAATAMQSLYRGKSGRRQVVQQHAAVVTVQALRRGYAARRQADKQKAAVLSFQSLQRARAPRQQYMQQRQAVRQVQALQRGRDGRRRAAKKQEAAAAEAAAAAEVEDTAAKAAAEMEPILAAAETAAAKFEAEAEEAVLANVMEDILARVVAASEASLEAEASSTLLTTEEASAPFSTTALVATPKAGSTINPFGAKKSAANLFGGSGAPSRVVAASKPRLSNGPLAALPRAAAVPLATPPHRAKLSSMAPSAASKAPPVSKPSLAEGVEATAAAKTAGATTVGMGEAAEVKVAALNAEFVTSTTAGGVAPMAPMPQLSTHVEWKPPKIADSVLGGPLDQPLDAEVIGH